MTRVSQFAMNLLRIGLGVALLAWVIHVTGGVRALDSLVTVPWLVPAFALQMALGAAVEARRLGWLAQALDVNVPFATGYRLVAVGTLFNNAIPGGTGGDLMKLYYLASENRSRTVELAKRYGSEQSGRFINGLLDGLLKRGDFAGSRE